MGKKTQKQFILLNESNTFYNSIKWGKRHCLNHEAMPWYQDVRLVIDALMAVIPDSPVQVV